MILSLNLGWSKLKILSKLSCDNLFRIFERRINNKFTVAKLSKNKNN